jgi:hypothetical protein
VNPYLPEEVVRRQEHEVSAAVPEVRDDVTLVRGHVLVVPGEDDQGVGSCELTDADLLTSVFFSPDGRLVLSSSEDGSVRLYRCEVCGNLAALTKLAKARIAAAR